MGLVQAQIGVVRVVIVCIIDEAAGFIEVIAFAASRALAGTSRKTVKAGAVAELEGGWGG